MESTEYVKKLEIIEERQKIIKRKYQLLLQPNIFSKNNIRERRH